MQATLFSGDGCAVSSGMQRTNRFSCGWWARILSILPLCLLLLACTPGDAAAFKRTNEAAWQTSGEVSARRGKSEEMHERTSAIALSELPVRAQQVYQLILQGGPFPYEKDGSVFGNRERLLPAQKRGFYREYTVAQPRARTRGAQRIVCGGPRYKPEACYYTADHYASFQRIVP